MAGNILPTNTNLPIKDMTPKTVKLPNPQVQVPITQMGSVINNAAFGLTNTIQINPANADNSKSADIKLSDNFEGVKKADTEIANDSVQKSTNKKKENIQINNFIDLISKVRIKWADIVAAHNKKDYVSYNKRYSKLLSILKSEFGENLRIEQTALGIFTIYEINEELDTECGQIITDFERNFVQLAYKSNDGTNVERGVYSDGEYYIDTNHKTKNEKLINHDVFTRKGKELKHKSTYKKLDDYGKCVYRKKRERTVVSDSIDSETYDRDGHVVRKHTRNTEFDIHGNMDEYNEHLINLMKRYEKTKKIKDGETFTEELDFAEKGNFKLVQKRTTDNFEETKIFSGLQSKSVDGVTPDEIITKINHGNIFEEIIEKYVNGETTKTSEIKDLQGNIISKGKLVWKTDIYGKKCITTDLQETFWSNHNKKSSISRRHDYFSDNQRVIGYNQEDYWENGNPKQVVTADKNNNQIDSWYFIVKQYDENNNLIGDYSINRSQNYEHGQPISESTTTTLYKIPGSSYNNGTIKTSMPIVTEGKSLYNKWSDATIQFDGVLNSNTPEQHTKISGSFVIDSSNNSISNLNNTNITHITLNTRNYDTTSGKAFYTEAGTQKQFNLKYNADTNTTQVFASSGKSFVIKGQVSNLAEFINVLLKQ